MTDALSSESLSATNTIDRQVVTPAESPWNFSSAPNVANNNQVVIVEEDDWSDDELAPGVPAASPSSNANSAAGALTPTFRWPPTALAFAKTTPWVARVFFPSVCIMTHLLFYYGQTAPMWKLRLVADIDVWANATEFATKQTFNLVGLKYDNHFLYQEDRDVQTFTYYYAINHLWLAKGIPGKVLPRLAAVLLIVFSGIWPHLKLAWLQLTWFFRKQASARTTTLQWLSTLGKWSLADVLVVCVMVGVLNLDWIVDPSAIKHGVISDLPAILQLVESQYDETGLCNKLLKLHCEKAKKATTRAKCRACTSVVTEAYTRPDWAQSTGKSILAGLDTSGGGKATLRVLGMRGIYAFCGAVIVSILLSLMVDIMDHRAKKELQRQQERERQVAVESPRPGTRGQQSAREGLRPIADQHMQEPLLGGTNAGRATPLELDIGDDDHGMLDTNHPPTVTLFSYHYLVWVIVTTFLVMAAVDWDSMERRVFGAGPKMLHDILGVDWERKYSLRSLMWTAGAHGGWDYMLMGTFGLFCVLGPVVRAVLLVVVTLLDRCRVPVDSLVNLINFIGAFCSWEVFAIAIVMVQMLMPSITNTIIKNKVCEKIADDGSCLQVEFNILPRTFWSVLLGGVLLIVVSLVAISRGTDRSTHATTRRTTSVSSRFPPLSSAMTPNPNCEGLQGFGQGTCGTTADDELDELVFETNEV